jgi:glucosamine-phosphate N-acetyltransferase
MTYQLVAVGSIILERKFTRGGGTIGHIEDIAVSKSMQGRKLGLKIINSLEAIGRGEGCYKIILDCSKDNIRTSFLRSAFPLLRFLLTI